MRNPLRFLRRRREPAPQSSEGAKVRLDSDGLRITEFSAPITNVLRLYGVGGNYASIYASQPNVRTAVDTYAKAGAGLSLKMFFKDDRGPMKPSARIEVRHDMMDLLDEPVPGESVWRFWYGLFADIKVYDIAYWLKFRQRGQVRALRRIPPANLTIQRDPITQQVLFFRSPDGQRIPTQDIVAFWGYDPATGHGAISPMESIRRVLAEEIAAGMDREGKWRNSARKDGVIERVVDSPQMSDNAKEAFLLDAEDSLGGATGSGRPFMLEPGMVYKDVQWSPREMEYINARKLSRLEVAAHFGLPPSLLAAAQNGDEADEDTLKMFYRFSLPPLLARVEAEIEAQLLPEFERDSESRRSFYLEFNLDGAMRGSPEEQMQIIATAAGGPVVTVNEARARLNLPPIPGGDLIFVPLNSIRAGGPQAGSQSPTQTPAQGMEPMGTTPGGGVQQASVADQLAGQVVVMGKQAEMLLSQDTESVDDVLRRIEQDAARRELKARFEERHAQVMRKFFARQRSLRVGVANRELADRLFDVGFQSLMALGADVSRAEGLKARSEEVAEQINEATLDQIAEGKEPDEVYGDDRATTLGVELTDWFLKLPV